MYWKTGELQWAHPSFSDSAPSLSPLASDADYWGICWRLTVRKNCAITLQCKQGHWHSPVRMHPLETGTGITTLLQVWCMSWALACLRLVSRTASPRANLPPLLPVLFSFIHMLMFQTLCWALGMNWWPVIDMVPALIEFYSNKKNILIK